jgi:hypothetical protein
MISKEDMEKYYELKPPSQNPLDKEILTISDSIYNPVKIGLENTFLLGQASIINMLNNLFKDHNTISKDYFNDIVEMSDDKLKEYIKKLSKEQI